MIHLIETVYRFLWGDLFVLPIAGGVGISLMVVLLLMAGVFFTLRTRLLPVRLFRDMISAVCEKNQSRDSLSSFQTLIVSTATRVGMGNLVGVVAAVSAGGAGAVFWMWVTALLGASTAFVESTLAQKYRQPDPLYGGQRGGPAYYIHVWAERKRKKPLRRSVVAVLFALSGLICWCGISQVVSNSVSSAFKNAFHIPPIATTVALVVLAAAFLGIRQYNKNASSATPTTEDTQETVLDVNSDDITSFCYVYEGETYAFEKKDETWYYTDDHSLNLNQDRIKAMILKVAPLKADQVIENVTDMSQYGLADPERTIQYETADRSVIINVGNLNSMTSQYYVAFPYEMKVYVVATNVVTGFNYTLEDLVEVEETAEETESTEATDTTITESETTETATETENVEAETAESETVATETTETVEAK